MLFLCSHAVSYLEEHNHIGLAKNTDAVFRVGSSCQYNFNRFMLEKRRSKRDHYTVESFLAPPLDIN